MEMHILILLIGSNPLPNYVTAKYLLDASRIDTDIAPVPDKIILLSSRETMAIGDVIISKLGLTDEKVIHRTLHRGQRAPETIITTLRESLANIQAVNGIASLHLNITGGTKPMAVFAAITAAHIGAACPHLLFSDLDPDRFLMRVYSSRDGNTMEHFLPRNASRDGLLALPKLKLGIADIVALHDMRLNQPGSDTRLEFARQPYPPALFKEMLGCHLSWKTDDIREVMTLRLREEDDTMRRTARAAFTSLLSRNADRFLALFPSLIPYVTLDRKSLTEEVNSPQALVHFFQGGWLEDFVLGTVQQLGNNGEIHIGEIRKNVEVLSRGLHNASFDRLAELDVVAMKGYQLFLISCTTSREIKLVKQKAFEALYRAEQLGGEHARVIVVSLMFNKPVEYNKQFSRDNNLIELEKDLTQFDARRTCHLIGVDELKGEVEDRHTLSKKLREIIEGVTV